MLQVARWGIRDAYVARGLAAVRHRDHELPNAIPKSNPGAYYGYFGGAASNSGFEELDGHRPHTLDLHDRNAIGPCEMGLPAGMCTNEPGGSR